MRVQAEICSEGNDEFITIFMHIFALELPSKMNR